MEKKQSSVEWFQEQIIKIVNGTCELSEIQIFEQAKAMHKEEIIETWIDGVSGWHYLNSEHYYNEVYLGIIKEQE